MYLQAINIAIFLKKILTYRVSSPGIGDIVHKRRELAEELGAQPFCGCRENSWQVHEPEFVGQKMDEF